MRAEFIIIASLLGLAIPTVAVPQSGITRHPFSVAGTNDEWTSTGIQVSPGDVVLVLAQGRVRIGQVMGEVGPKGASGGEGALMLKIGVRAGERVGDKAFLIAEDAGEVKLRVADSRYDDNAGAFDVVIMHIPASAIPDGSPSIAADVIPDAVRAPLAAVRSDLRNLVTAEEAFFADSVRYAKSLRAMQFQTSTGVTVILDEVAADAWRAHATHLRAPGWACGIYVGDMRGYVVEQKEGEPKCWKTK